MKTFIRYLILAAIGLSACTPRSQADIKRNEQRWLDQSISSYQIQVLHISSIWHAQTYIITVKDGKVTDSTSTCFPAPYEAGECKVEPYNPEEWTVPGLFALARSQSDSEYSKYVTIRFNQQYGYPEQISYNHPDIVDEDNSWTVESFTPQP